MPHYFSSIWPAGQENYNQVPFVVTHHETLGKMITELLKEGRNINRTAICCKLICYLETAQSQEEERHYSDIIKLLLKG